jgi:nickel-dependent lactate racemase
MFQTAPSGARGREPARVERESQASFLTYGAGRIAFRPPGEVRTLLPLGAPPAAPEAELVRRALDEPLGTPPLRELARGRRSAIVLVACRTRRTGSPVFLPEIARELAAAGIPEERILVYAATGTHDNWRAGDAALLAGPDCARRLRFAGHDCRADLEPVGTTSRGNRVRLARAYLESELKIATGRVTHHYFAGFTGGRKAILPGVSDFDSIVFNHRLATATEGGVRLHPEARNGQLAGNPVHLDMLEAARLAPPDFTLATVLDTGDRIVQAFGGDMEQSHEAAVKLVRDSDAPCATPPADWLFASCGGAHLDVNAVQSIKALVNNFRAVRRGGAIILAAECAEGIAPWLREVCSLGREELAARVLRGELRHPHNALWLRAVRERAHVILVSRLREDEVRDLGFRRAPDLERAIALARELAGPPATCAVVPYGNTTVARGEDA